MKREYQLSHDTFDRLDFSESFLIRYETKEDVLILIIWGCALHKFNNPEFSAIIAKDCSDESLYIAGYSEFQLTGFASYSIKTVLYEEWVLGNPFRKDTDGNYVTVHETKIGNNQLHGVLHEFECVNTQVFGYSIVQINAASTIHFIFNDDDFISVDTFVHNPQKYTPPELRK